MEILHTRGEATVLQIAGALPDPPTPMAVRRMLHILVEKGHLKARKQSREVVYAPVEKRAKAGSSALQRVLETFFDGSLEEALAAHLVSKKGRLDDAESARLMKLIEEARQSGR